MNHFQNIELLFSFEYHFRRQRFFSPFNSCPLPANATVCVWTPHYAVLTDDTLNEQRQMTEYVLRERPSVLRAIRFFCIILFSMPGMCVCVSLMCAKATVTILHSISWCVFFCHFAQYTCKFLGSDEKCLGVLVQLTTTIPHSLDWFDFMHMKWLFAKLNVKCE